MYDFDKEVILTNHAKERLWERAGLKKGAAARLAHIAYRKGIRAEIANGCLMNYLDRQEERDAGKNNIRVVYGEMTYIFNDDNEKAVLITAYRVPNRIKKQAIGTQRRAKTI